MTEIIGHVPKVESFISKILTTDIGLDGAIQGELLKAATSTFTDDERQMFVKSMMMYAVYKDDEFVVSLDDIWAWLGYGRKSDAKKLLERELILNEDYIIKSDTAIAVSLGGLLGKTNQIILLTVDAFKSLCMAAGTLRSKSIRKYFLKVEKEYKDSINGKVTKQLEEMQLTLANKDSQLMHMDRQLAASNLQLVKTSDHVISMSKTNKALNDNNQTVLAHNVALKAAKKVSLEEAYKGKSVFYTSSTIRVPGRIITTNGVPREDPRKNHKLGFTNDYKRRLDDHQREIGDDELELDLVIETPYNRELEADLKKEFKDYMITVQYNKRTNGKDSPHTEIVDFSRNLTFEMYTQRAYEILRSYNDKEMAIKYRDETYELYSRIDIFKRTIEKQDREICSLKVKLSSIIPIIPIEDDHTITIPTTIESTQEEVQIVDAPVVKDIPVITEEEDNRKNNTGDSKPVIMTDTYNNYIRTFPSMQQTGRWLEKNHSLKNGLGCVSGSIASGSVVVHRYKFFYESDGDSIKVLERDINNGIRASGNLFSYRFMINSKYYSKGSFVTREAAADARDKARVQAIEDAENGTQVKLPTRQEIVMTNVTDGTTTTFKNKVLAGKWLDDNTKCKKGSGSVLNSVKNGSLVVRKYRFTEIDCAIDDIEYDPKMHVNITKTIYANKYSYIPYIMVNGVRHKLATLDTLRAAFELQQSEYKKATGMDYVPHNPRIPTLVTVDDVPILLESKTDARLPKNALKV